MLSRLKPPLGEFWLSKRDLFRAGDAHRDAGRWSEAAAAYRKGLALDGGVFPIWVQLGNVLKESGDMQAAEAAYMAALRINAADSDLHLQLGHLYTRDRKMEMAKTHYRTAASLGSDDPHTVQTDAPGDTVESLFQRADACRERRTWKEAAVFYEKGLARKPAAFEMWVQLGHACKEMGAHRRAEAAYLRALELRYDDQDLSLQLGHLYAIMADEVRAADCYCRAIGLGSRDQHALAFLSRQTGHNRSMKIALARVLSGEERKMAVLGSSDEEQNFAKFIMRFAA